MIILHESEVFADISRLNQAWDESETFALLPDRSGVSAPWITEGLQGAPDQFSVGHFVLLTSGSTGQPKMIFGRRERAERLAHTLHELQESEEVGQSVVCLPLSYCYAFVNQWLWARLYDRELVLTRGFKDPQSLQRALLQADNAQLCLVGAQVPLLLENFPDTSFPGIIRLHFAGGQFPQQSLDSINRLFPRAKIFNNYGCAEALPRLTLRPAAESDEGANVGRPLPGVAMQANNAGEILFQSEYGCVGYYDDNGFRAIGDDDWIASGDLGEPIDRGCWRITGRANEVFKRYGEKIGLPRLLKTVYEVWPGQAAFYRERDSHGEEGHVLVLCPSPDDTTVRAILGQFRNHYARPHWPLRVESIDRLPLLENGKVDVLTLSQIDVKIVHWRQRL